MPYRLHDEAAALHLFRVAAGLDSLVPGEGEILGQVRAAYEAGAAGPLLDRVFRQALHAGKQARAETAIGESPASVSAAAAALAQQVFGDLEGRRVLLVGAGRVGELAARNLSARGARVAFVANRTRRAAAELRSHCSAARPLSARRGRGELGEVDVVVASTSAPRVRLTREAVERAIRGRKGGRLFFIDLAVPRDVDPAVHQLDGCYLYDIDDLEAVVAETSRAGAARRSAPRRSWPRRRSGSATGRPRSTSFPRSRRCARMAEEIRDSASWRRRKGGSAGSRRASAGPSSR